MNEFLVTVRPKYGVFRCPARIAKEAAGYFTHSPKCPDCRTVLEGFEMWGENGHLQASTSCLVRPTTAELEVMFNRRQLSTKTVFKHEEDGFRYLRS